MKKVFIALLSFLTLSAWGQGGGSLLRFDDLVWDFGTIQEVRGKVSHTFTFTNTGSQPVVVESVEASCSCTVPFFSRAPVMPGKEGTIEVTYDPRDRPGVFIRDITVVSGGGKNVVVLKIKGLVTPRPRTVEDDYPFELQQGLRLTTGYLNFDRVGQGQAKSMVIGCVNTSRRDVELRVADPDAAAWFRIAAPAKICAGCRADITLTFDLTRTTAWGVLCAQPDIYINGVKNGHGIVATVLATDNFDGVGIDSAPKSKLDAQFFHFGDASAGKKLSHSFTLENVGASTLIVRAVKYGNGTTGSLREGTRIEPGRSVRFSITLPTEGTMGGRVIGSVTLIVNDPIRPMREIRLVANVN
ncbi:hypothetical protein FACS1894159_01100 [Bacteroidia bacterium]|nr:hypothetical protein FACS1894159_01100 [Bacteroidia bacterium]